MSKSLREVSVEEFENMINVSANGAMKNEHVLKAGVWFLELMEHENICNLRNKRLDDLLKLDCSGLLDTCKLKEKYVNLFTYNEKGYLFGGEWARGQLWNVSDALYKECVDSYNKTASQFPFCVGREAAEMSAEAHQKWLLKLAKKIVLLVVPVYYNIPSHLEVFFKK